jgi:hypothetical protein
MYTTIKITLVVKGDRLLAMEEVNRRLAGPLSSWFVEDAVMHAPFSDGSLLWYRIDDGVAR